MTQKEKIGKLLETEVIGKNLLWFDSLPSTNDFLKSAAEELPNGSVAVAAEQTAGRGRRGNVWFSPKGQLAISILLKDRLSLSMPPVTLICGLAVAKALQRLYGDGFFIKWPNDIVCKNKKVCGILCEAKLSKEGTYTVCGVGVNLTQDPEYFAAAGVPYGASIGMLTGKAPQIPQVAAAILNSFEQIYSAVLQPSEKANSAFFEEYCKNCITLGKEIKAVTPGGEIRGVAKAVNGDGSLRVLCGEKTLTLFASEVSVRGVMGYI